jgi:hypothetical protein
LFGITEAVGGDLFAIGRRDLESLQRNAQFANITGCTRCVIVTVLNTQLFRGDESVGEDVIDDGLGSFGGNRSQLRQEFCRQLCFRSFLLSWHLGVLTTKPIGLI